MYSFGSRRDTEIVDEPLFAHYLLESGAERPSRQEVLKTMESDPKTLIQSMRRPSTSKPHRFLKHMACHLRGFAPEIFAEDIHLILVRHPSRVLKSYSAHIDQPTLEDLGYAWQWNWLKRCQTEGWPVAVLDSDAVVARPEASLRKVCEFLGLEWDPEMLRWPAGGRAEDGVWARFWYDRIHKSTGWEPASSGHLPAVSAQLSEVHAACLPYYAKLIESSLI
jgi:hypothetical protein